MAEDDTNPWKWCKLIEEESDGQIILLRENFEKLRKLVLREEFENVPVTLISAVGPPLCGKSLFTNIFAEFLRSEGRNWATSIQDNGLKGFSFGNQNNHPSSQDHFIPDEVKSGIYFWPQPFPLQHYKETKLAWIMHIHQTTKDKYDDTNWNNSLNKFMLCVSSAVVDIVVKQESYTKCLLSNVKDPVRSEFCQHIVYIQLRSASEEEAVDCSDIPKERLCKIDRIAFIDENGRVSFKPKQYRALDSIMKQATDKTALQPKIFQDTRLTWSSMETCLQHVIQLINSTRESPNTPSAVSERPPKKENPVQVERKVTNTTEPEDRHDVKVTQRNVGLKFDSKKTPATRETISKPSEQPRPSTRSENLVHETKNLPVKVQNTQTPDQPNQSTSEANVPMGIPEYAKRLMTHSPIWQKLHDLLTQWIETDLRRDKINEIENTFNPFVQKIITEEVSQGKSPIQSSQEFRLYASSEIAAKFKSIFSQIQAEINNFCMRMDAQFKTIAYFSLDDLSHNLKVTLNKIISGIDDERIASLVGSGCAKLFSFYKSFNQKRFMDEKTISSNIHQQLVAFYQDEIQREINSVQYHHPDNLFKMHHALLRQLTKVLVDSVGGITQVESTSKEALAAELNKRFEEFERKNNLKIEAAQKNISSLIAKMKAKYEIEMDNLLQEHPDGVEEATFSKEHKKAAKQVIQQFKTDIQDIIHPNENTERHEGTLRTHIEKSRELFAEENRDVLKSNNPDPPEVEDDKKQDHPLKSHEKSQSLVDIAPQSPQTQLPPILFHLGLHRIGIGILNERNKDIDIVYAQAQIALTKDNEWIYGDQVRDKLCSEGDGALIHTWNLNQLFPMSSPPTNNGLASWSEEIFHENNKLMLTTEFIFGMLLHSIKQRLEDEHNGQVSMLMISVPFWFPSYQRKQVVDAGKVAGFMEVHLLNENTSAAYFVHSSGLHPKHFDTMVLSESSHRFDVSLYSYDSGVKKLAMLGHSGDYEQDAPGENIGWIKSIFVGIKNLVGGSRPPQEEDLAIKQLASLWKHCVSVAGNQHFCQMALQRKVLIFCESNSWEDLLVKVAKKVGNDEITIQHDFTIHGMASMYHVYTQNVSTFQNIIRDGIPFYVNIYPPLGDKKVGQRKVDSFSSITVKQRFSCKLPAYRGSYLVCQENSAGMFPVVQLVVQERHNGFNEIEITLFRSRDGIIHLRNIEWMRKGFNGVVDKQKFQNNDANLRSLNIDESMVAYYSNIIHEISFAKSSSGRLATAKELGKEKVEAIQAAINTGKISFPSPIVKTLFLKQVNDALEYIMECDSHEAVDEKINWLNKLCAKFNIE